MQQFLLNLNKFHLKEYCSPNPHCSKNLKSPIVKINDSEDPFTFPGIGVCVRVCVWKKKHFIGETVVQNIAAVFQIFWSYKTCDPPQISVSCSNSLGITLRHTFSNMVSVVSAISSVPFLLARRAIRKTTNATRFPSSSLITGVVFSKKKVVRKCDLNYLVFFSVNDDHTHARTYKPI